MQGRSSCEQWCPDPLTSPLAAEMNRMSDAPVMCVLSPKGPAACRSKTRAARVCAHGQKIGLRVFNVSTCQHMRQCFMYDAVFTGCQFFLKLVNNE